MQILFVTHYYDPESGAAAVRLSRLARLLQQNGHSVTVLTTMPNYPTGIIHDDYRGKWSTREIRDGITVIQVWLWTTTAKSIGKRLISQLSFMVTAFLRGLTLPRPDVVFIENQPMFTGFAGRLLADVKRAPYVLNVSDLWPDHLLAVGALTKTSPIYRVARAMVDAGYRGAEQTIVLSPGFVDILETQQAAVKGKVQSQLNGVDTDRFYPMTADEIQPFYDKYDLDPDKHWVSFMGTFATPYDFELMLDVAAAFRERDDVGFLFVGTGTQEALVAERIERDDLSNIQRVKWVEHHEMPLAWNASTISYWALHAGMLNVHVIPAKLFELFACGVPIVAAQDAISNDIIREAGAGFTVQPGDSAGLIACIEQLLSDDALRQACREGARTYAEKYLDQHQVASTYEKVLQAATQE